MAEKEYIERGALIAEIDRNEPSNWTDTEAEIQSILDYRLYKGIAISQPAADVVAVVRCKDCVHYQNGACNHFGYYTYAPDVDEDDFCSYGERKEQK